MPNFLHTSRFPVPAEELEAWHERPGAEERLVPPWGNDAVRPGKQFKHWEHQRRIRAERKDVANLEDEVIYTLPGLGLGSGRIRKSLHQTFVFRHQRTRLDLHRHEPHRDKPPLRVAITGASGLIGSALSHFLTSGGHEVYPLVRRPPRPGSNEIEWDPERGRVNCPALEGMDAVIHLAGANIAGQRWTPRYKALIASSRINGTRTLATALAKLKKPPRRFLSASAVGIYGHRDEPLTEDSAPGQGFLCETGCAWEAATEPAERVGIPVTHMRFGVVLSPAGGALSEMLRPFRMGVGGKLGSGKQGMSWIALDDLIGAIHWILFHDELTGTVNLTGPKPVSNAEFTKAMGRVLNRPTFFAMPAFVVKQLFGEMGEALLLEGNFVHPTRLLESGFQFECDTVERALRAELGL